METRVARVGTSTFQAVVRRVVVETDEARTLILDAESTSDYSAGQYVTIDPHQFESLRALIAYLEGVKGRREAPRAYSLSSAPHEPYLAITIKQETGEPGRAPYPPLLSGLLVHGIRAGETITLRGFLGAYTLPGAIAARLDHVLHLCAGSGSVANLSILKDSLRRDVHLRHTFVYSNRTWQDVIFRDELEHLGRQHPARLRVIHRLTRQSPPFASGADVAAGRIDRNLVQALLSQEPHSRIYICGPGVTVRERRACAARGIDPAPRFIEDMLGHLSLLGVERTQIKIESYG